LRALTYNYLQGGSVINTFLNDPTWKIRTITRNVTKPQSIALQEKGVEVVQGDLNNVETLIAAIQGANVVFGVTDFWEPFFNPATQEKLAPGQLINQYCYGVELQQGKNIADAVATIADTTLDLFVWSTLAHVKKWSNGKYTWVYHFDSKAEIYDYAKKSLPQLAKKTSSVLIGNYADNWISAPFTAPQKAADGVYELSTFAKAETLNPWVDTRGDTGKFVRALVQAPPGKDLLGVSEMVT
jgi:NmrA-like family